MGHLLKTVNPEAAADIANETKPIPCIGETVIFFPRPGELRAGRGKHAAIVTAVNDDDTLDLVVVYDADDFIGQRRVARRSLDGGMGWETRKVETAHSDPRLHDICNRVDALEKATETIRALVLGKLTMPNGESVLGILDEHEDRLDRLEKRKSKDG